MKKLISRSSKHACALSCAIILAILPVTNAANRNWSRGDIYIDQVAYLIDCKITRPLEFEQCKSEVRKDGMSQARSKTGFARREECNEIEEGAMVRFYGNKTTKIYHSNKKNDSCRRGEILKKNRAEFNQPPPGYRGCKLCVSNPRQDERSDD